MPPSLDRSLLKSATEIFDSLGIVLADLQIYGEGHPRFQHTTEHTCSLLSRYFEMRPGAGALLYTMEEGSVEYQRIPLVDMPSLGEKLRKSLVDISIGILKLERGVTREDLILLAKTIVARLRGHDGTPEVASEKPGGRFSLVSTEDARLYRTAKNVGDASSDLDMSMALPCLAISEGVLSTVLSTYRDLATNAERGRALDYESLNKTAQKVVQLLGDGASSTPISQGYFDDFTFHHSVNVCLITTRLASFIVKDQELLSRISMAALLHDIGKMRIPVEILHKPGKLTPGEVELMRKHPMLGAEILVGTEGIDPLSVNVAFGHHRFGGRKAYPQTAFPYRVDWITQLISVVDIHEALTAMRPYKKALASDKAFQVMLSMPGFRDRLPIIKMLFDLLGPYPVGAVVELNSGERAVVLEQNPSTPYRPRVRILTDSTRVPLPIPREVDLAAQTATAPLSVKVMVVVQTASDDPLQADISSDSGEVMKDVVKDEEMFLLQEA